MTELHKRILDAGAGEKPDALVAEEVGCPVRIVGYVRRQHNIKLFNGFYLTQEGDVCRSVCEAMYDAWLHDNNIEHQHEVRIKSLKVIVDFKLGDQFVEIIGMVGYGPYDRRLKQKKKIYENAGISVQYLTVKDVYCLYSTSSTKVRTAQKRVCAICGKETVLWLRGVCKGSCYMKLWRQETNVIANCIQCGEEFSKTGEEKFCTRKCYWKSLKTLDVPDEATVAKMWETRSLRSVAIELGIKPTSLYMRMQRYIQRLPDGPEKEHLLSLGKKSQAWKLRSKEGC